MEQLLIRGLREGTKRALKLRAQAHSRSMEAEGRAIIESAFEDQQSSLSELLAMEDGADISFDPPRLGLGRCVDDEMS
ncbi:antitoxin [Schaalia sp. ZJ1691]|uniref:FitA-like ribbon-helix-helix domain-containing protein n=1 Tax=Schaalia sp. ZJ1691 TaxID=2709404 RepID=UPI0013E9A2FC|nr:antitoxin [Schaalia sp. ZJ1691]